MKSGRKRAPFHGNIKEPVVHQHLIHLDSLFQFRAAGMLGNAYMQFEMMGMY